MSGRELAICILVTQQTNGSILEGFKEGRSERSEDEEEILLLVLRR